MKAYEQIVRVLTAFFAAMVGIGLKNVLEGSSSYRIPCFIIAVCLSLRFITGSTTHLYLEYVEKRDAPILGLIWDFFVLMVFGGLCALLCSAKNIDTFWGFCIAITGVAFIWGALVMFTLRIFKKVSMGEFIKNAKWSEWMLINGFQLGVFVLTIYSEHSYPPDPVLHGELWVVVTFSVMFLVWDLHYQLCNVRNAFLDREEAAFLAAGMCFAGESRELSLWQFYMAYRNRARG